MNISRLPGDLLLDVAYQIDDAETLLNIAQVWRPMRTMITSGHATDLEAKMRLKEAKMIEGPGVSNLTRGRGHQEFISKILRYSLGWSDLQWTSESFWGLPTAVNTQWNDGTRPTDPCFVGESGGCIYNVFSVPGLHHSDLYITRPPSERTGREVSQFILKMDFPIRAVAIDVASKHVVLLELRPWQEGDALFHFYDFNGTMLRLPYSWHANWRYEVIVRQFEVVDGMLGFLSAPAFEPTGWILFLDWKNPHGQRQWPHPTADGDHWSFQFVRRDLVLISEESILPGHFMRGAHLRLVSLSRNSRITQDPQNNWIQQLPLAGLKPFERVVRATLVPYVPPIQDQNLDYAAPFCFDPSQRLIGIKYEYQRSWGEVEHVLEIGQIGREGIQRLQSLNYAAMHQITGNYVFIGRQLMWPMRISSDEGRKGLYIRSVDFNMSSGPSLPPRTCNRHPQAEKKWVVVKDGIQNGNPRLPQIPVTTTVSPLLGASRAIFTQDNIIFLVKGDQIGRRDLPILCALSYNF